MQRVRKLAFLAAAGTMIGVVGIGGSVDAGEEPAAEVDVFVDVYVRGPDPATVAAGLSIEFYEMPGGTAVPGHGGCVDSAGVLDNPYNYETIGIACTLPGEQVTPHDYAIGVSGAPAGWEVEAYCGTTELEEQITSGNPEFTITPPTYRVDCSIYVTTWVLLLDKVVLGDGPDGSSDFELEVYDSGGVLAGTGTDPADATCNIDYDPANCLALALPSGVGYAVGEVPVDYGYEVTDVSCEQYITVDGGQAGQNEIIDIPGATFDHDDGDTYCVVTNTYREGQLTVTAVVTNDEGGTASATDVSIEVFRADGTPVIAATACAADGTCLDVALPTGDYVIGYVGPAGYTRSVTQTVSTPTEQINDDPDAAFTMGPFDQVEIVVTIDDPTPPTTTTTTTTLAPTTTTLAPTTSAIGILPATGTSSSANSLMALVALVLVAAGGALTLVRRERS